MLEGDVGLSADVHHVDFLREAVGAATRAAADDLHHHGLLGTAEGLHRALMARLGELLAVNLQGEEEEVVEVEVEEEEVVVTVMVE